METKQQQRMPRATMLRNMPSSAPSVSQALLIESSELPRVVGTTIIPISQSRKRRAEKLCNLSKITQFPTGVSCCEPTQVDSTANTLNYHVVLSVCSHTKAVSVPTQGSSLGVF